MYIPFIIVDILLIAGIFIFFQIENKNQSGFFFDPYLGVHIFLVYGPAFIGIVNVVVLLICALTGVFSLSMLWFVFTPFLGPLSVYFYQWQEDTRGAYFWKKYVVPMEKEIREYLKERGFEQVKQVAVIPRKNNKNTDGEVRIEVVKEDKERLESVRKELREELIGKYPKYRFYLYGNSR